MLRDLLAARDVVRRTPLDGNRTAEADGKDEGVRLAWGWLGERLPRNAVARRRPL